MFLQQYTKEFVANIKIAWPVILGMLGHTFVSFADNIMVGQLGTAELAAVSLANSFVFVAMSLGIGFSTAITPLVAEANGAGDEQKAKKIFQNGLVLCFSLAILLFFLLLVAKPCMQIMNQPEEVVVLALPYLNLVALSLIPLIVFQGFKQFLDGLSETKFPMYATLIGNLMNIGLNYLLIFGNFGFPKMEIIGAAIGTLIARSFMVIIIWYILKTNKKFTYFVNKFNFKVIQKLQISKILNLGFPSSLQMLFEVGLFTAAIWLSGVLGKNPQAANQIALNLSSMTYMVGMGLGVAAMVRVGNQKGLHHYKNLRRVALSVFLLTLFIEIVFAVIFLLLRHWLPTLYVDESNTMNVLDNTEVIILAGDLLLMAAFFQISDGIQVVVLAALRGLQDVKIPTYITFISYWIIGFSACIYFGLYTSLKSQGIWIGLLIGLTVASVLLFLRFHYITKKLILKN